MSSEDRRRRLIGVVVSDKMEKTIVVNVERSIRHPLYKKVLRRSKRYQAHDDTGTAKQGDTVEIIETKPISANKRWALVQVIKKGD
ncbi:MAG TPA: 30S ribosomal protein S17 [Thermoflexales bacterium]|jgi:small subunit ribosomal protein S17|nr:30S ribosomal protein S17 [Anaerolineae bacterium]HQV28633.1 30S ribosomal protein S17 [Thermoflexales bacterium]HQX11185.1 30S ribosomal protein S17 [Thermoflexales bacterium]HQY24224.1 30S ribosomal protein S17 [Thermoflexales bacterium]HQZ53928.1 30S ribosomal protein S17 [Thermoflexales bacterium]